MRIKPVPVQDNSTNLKGLHIIKRLQEVSRNLVKVYDEMEQIYQKCIESSKENPVVPTQNLPDIEEVEEQEWPEWDPPEGINLSELHFDFDRS